MQNRISIDLLSGRYADTQRVGKWHPLRVRENKSSGFMILRSSFDSGDADVEYGPKFIRIKSGKRTGRVFYRPEDVENWLISKEQFPEGAANV